MRLERAQGYDVGIVGVGFCAARLAIHLMRSATGRLSIAIVNRDHRIGRSVAYGSEGTPDLAWGL